MELPLAEHTSFNVNMPFKLHSKEMSRYVLLMSYKMIAILHVLKD